MSSERTDAALAGLRPDEQVALLHRTLAEMCRAEVPLPRALRAVADDLGRSPLADEVRGMAEDVERGTPLADAYGARALRLPTAYRGLIEAGIACGDLPGVLEEIATHASARAEVEGKLRRALAYPALAGACVLVVATFLLVFVAPRMRDLSAAAQGAGDLLFATTRADSFFSLVDRPWFVPALVAALAAIALAALWAFARLRRPLDGARGVASLAYRWPVLGRLRLYAALASLTATISLLLRRRVPLPRALDLAAETCEDPDLRGRVRSMADAAHGGASLAQSLVAGAVLAPSLAWIVESAEGRGAAPEALDDVARVYRDRLTRAADRAALWITPAAELAVGLGVLLVAYAFLGEISLMTLRVLGIRV